MRKTLDCTLRAYADDTALVHKNIWSVVGKLQDIFYEHERISGLALNIRKAVLVPLTSFDPARARAHSWWSTPRSGGRWISTPRPSTLD